MTTDDQSDTAGGAVCVAAAEQVFLTAIDELRRSLERLRAEDVSSVPDLKKAAVATSEAVRHLLRERQRVQDLQDKLAGGAGAGAIDLDAARSEIGRRLACLRDARDD